MSGEASTGAAAGERVVFHKAGDKDCEAHYKLGRTLGQGSFATVRLATEIGVAQGHTWAVKVIKRSALTVEDAASLQSEMTVLQRLSHPHIVSTHEIFDAPHFVYVVMECMSGGELFDRIVSKEHYSEAEARVAVWQVLSAIDYCHDLGVVHRDLKPENLLYSSPSSDALLKLADFGLAKLLKPHELMHNQCGTPGYVAPEVLSSNSHHGYGPECDLWSIGVIVYILICGFPPFYDDDNEVLFNLISNATFDYPSPYWDGVGADVKNLIDGLLVVDPALRLTAKQALQHPWITREDHSVEAMKSAQAQLKKYNTRRRFRGAIRAVQMANVRKHGISLPPPLPRRPLTLLSSPPLPLPSSPLPSPSPSPSPSFHSLLLHRFSRSWSLTTTRPRHLAEKSSCPFISKDSITLASLSTPCSFDTISHVSKTNSST